MKLIKIRINLFLFLIKLKYIYFNKFKIRIMKYKIGDKVIIKKNNTSHHNYAIGEIYTVFNVYTNNNKYTLKSKDGLIGNLISENDITTFHYNKKYLIDKLKEIEKEIQMNDDMIYFLNETKDTNVQMEKFISWQILKIANSKDKDNLIKMTRILNSMNNINYNDIYKIIH